MGDWEGKSEIKRKWRDELKEGKKELNHCQPCKHSQRKHSIERSILKY